MNQHENIQQPQDHNNTCKLAKNAMRKQFDLEATTIPYLPKEACEIKSKFESFVQKQNYFTKL